MRFKTSECYLGTKYVCIDMLGYILYVFFRRQILLNALNLAHFCVESVTVTLEGVYISSLCI